MIDQIVKNTLIQGIDMESAPFSTGRTNRYVTHTVGRRLGYGVYSSVYQHKVYADRVVKIFYRDEGYEAFVMIVLKHKCSSFPKVYATYRNGGRLFVEMEKLRVARTKSEQLSASPVAYEKPTIGFMHGLTDKQRSKIPNSFVKALRILWREKLFIRYINDLHPGNILWRGDVPVIIDPVCPRA